MWRYPCHLHLPRLRHRRWRAFGAVMNKFLSRKLIVALVSAIATVILQHLNASQATISEVVGIAATYIGGQSIADAAAAFKNTNLSSQGQ